MSSLNLKHLHNLNPAAENSGACYIFNPLLKVFLLSPRLNAEDNSSCRTKFDEQKPIFIQLKGKINRSGKISPIFWSDRFERLELKIEISFISAFQACLNSATPPPGGLEACQFT